ncbi:MAG: hypothetical protein SGJ19_00680 [Planctomycetia bacterium]|nr:hypothetical protein [Planctomycetia bacterium]
MNVKVKARPLTDVVEGLGGFDELSWVLVDLTTGERTLRAALQQARKAIDSATNDRGKVVPSKLDHDALAEAVATMRLDVAEAGVMQEALLDALQWVERDIEELAEAVGV